MKTIRALLCALVWIVSGNAHATAIDWSTVSLSGSFPVFTFSDALLGTVTLNYSGDSEAYGLNPSAFPEATLMLGNTSGEQLTMSWTNSVQVLDLRIWDIDSADPSSSESVRFSSAASTIAPLFLNSTDLWNSATNTLFSDGSTTPNSTPGNYSIIRFQDSLGFNSITFDWTITGNFTGILGIGRVGQFELPEPPMIALFLPGLLLS